MKFVKIIVLLVLGTIVVVSCKNEDNFLEYKDPLTLKPELLNGIWQAKTVIQFDKEAVDNGFPQDVQQRDITSLFPFEEYQITFSLDAQGRPGNFEITPGNSPNLLNLESGIWALDDYVFARTISLSNPTEFNTSSFRIEVLKNDNIKLHIVRNDLQDGTEYSYYQFEFVKI